MATLASFRTSVRARLGVPANDTFFTDQQVSEAINLAIDRLSNEARWPWDESLASSTLTPGTYSYALPAGWVSTRTVLVVGADGSVNEIAPSSPADVLSYTSTGLPERWAISGTNLWLGPTPNQAYTWRHIFTASPTRLAGDSDTPRIPATYDDAVIVGAAAILSEREDNRAQMQAFLSEYETWVARMRRSVRGSTRPTVPKIRPGSWLS